MSATQDGEDGPFCLSQGRDPHPGSIVRKNGRTCAKRVCLLLRLAHPALRDRDWREAEV